MKPRIFLIILISLAAGWLSSPFNKGMIRVGSFYRDLSLRLGLDLRGGVHLSYQVDVSAIASANRATAVESIKTNIERRVNLLGVAEPVIQTAKSGEDYRLLVELAGITDINQAINLIGQTARLEFRETKAATPSSQADFSFTGLGGEDLQIAQVQFNNQSGKVAGTPAVSLEFTADGTKKFSEITARNLGKPLAVFLDNQLVTAPTVQSIISDGRAVVTGNFTVDEAKKLAIQLNAGALPAPIKIVEQRNVGATLGDDSIKKSMFAGAVALGVVCLFMIANYGIKGILADVALVIYVMLTVALIKIIPVTLTLSGIAGLILSIGMAVDANILIFERIKEELAWGRPLTAAIELGFHRAWNSIKDSNVSSLITAGILFWFGTGSVRGFALTLALGIGVSLFSAITVTKTLLDLVYTKRK